MVQSRDTNTDVVVGPIVLVGMMGVGKTSVGLKLAAMLDFEHVDSDVEIEKAADRSIPEIFAEFGEAYFREGEIRVMERLLAKRPQVISTGGGAFIQEKIRKLVKQNAISVWLDSDVDLLWERVRQKPGRPLLDQPNPREVLERLTLERAEFYAQADVHITVARDMGLQDVADAIQAALKERAPV